MLQKREVTVLIVLITAIILTGYYCFFFKPRAKAIGKLIPQVAKMKREVRNTESDIADIDNLKRKIDTLKIKVDYYEESLPSEKEIPALLKSLSGLASESGVKIIAIQPLDIAKPRSKDLSDQPLAYLEVPIAITAECGYHQLGSFINKLETSRRFMKVTDIEIRGNPKTPPRHDVKLLISMFVLEWK